MIEYITSFYITLGFSAFFGALGYYIGERGWNGVKIDVDNIKLDVAKLQGAVSKKAS